MPAQRHTTEDGAWTYHVLDDSSVCVDRCNVAQRTVRIPERIDGKAVVALAPDSCSQMEDVEEIVCEDGIREIGSYAFRRCPHLRRVVLPVDVDVYSASWLDECPTLQEIVLPGKLKVLPRSVFDCSSLRKLVIGCELDSIELGAFERSSLEEVEIDGENRSLMTDGAALYTHDGSLLVALALPVETYSIAESCTSVAEKAFYGMGQLRAVELGSHVQTIGRLAFAHSGIGSIVFPGSTFAVGERAFFGCKCLESAVVPEGMKAIGDEAFAQSGLRELRLPASVSHIGKRVAHGTEIVFSGPTATFEIVPSSEHYFVDERGGLYRKSEGEVHFSELLDPDAEAYEVSAGTRTVEARACAYHGELKAVRLPEGLELIGESAFRVCRKLKRIDVPETLREVGDEAFIDSVLESFKVPCALERLGTRALVTEGAHHDGMAPSLRSIGVDPRNERFFMHDGMLCERVTDGLRIVAFTSSKAHVAFPDEVEEVADYAFNNAFGIEELRLNARLHAIGACGLSVWCWIKHIHIDIAKPIEGRTSFDLYFPDTSRSIHGFLVAVGMSNEIFMPTVMAHYDRCIAMARDYHAPVGDGNISAYDQIRLVIDRLEDPVLLTAESKRRYDMLIRGHLEDICLDIARHDDRLSIHKLVELGYLDESNLERVIDAVVVLQDAAMTGYLLELKRMRFNKAAFDFEL